MVQLRWWIGGLVVLVSSTAAGGNLCAPPVASLKQLSVVETTTAADRAFAKSLGPVVADHGHYVVVSGLAKAGRQALPGQFIESRVRPLDTRIELRNLSFDPASDVPDAVRAACAGVKTDSEAVFVLQLAAPASDATLADLSKRGLDVLQYLPQQAFLVKARRSAVEAAADLSTVRWVGVLPAAAKLAPALDWVFAAESDKPSGNFGKSTKAPYDIAVLESFSLESVRQTVEQLGSQPEVISQAILPNNYFNVLRVFLAPEDLKPVSALPGVIAIDPYIAPTREDERAAQIVAGNFVGNVLNAPGYNPLTQFGVTGIGVTVAVVDDGVGIPGDGGFYVTNANTVNGPLRGATAGAQGHGHLQASIIAGTAPFSTLDPTGYNYGLGIAPNAHIVNIPFLRFGYSGLEADTANDAVTTPGPNGVISNLSNNSWGSGTNGNAYDALAAQFDGFVRDASSAASIDPLSIIFSAGNQGTNGLTRPKVAKNVITVASSDNLRTEIDPAANNLEEVSDFSSRGLAADGRVKPDITAPGQGVTGGRSGPDVLFGNIDANHRWSSGTSHAAPQVAGAAALFTQWWKMGNAGANPSPAMVKAALLNGATEMTGSTTAAAIPNGTEGWGRVNLRRVLNTGIATQYIDQTTTLQNVGNASTFVGTVASTAAPIRVSLVWTDPPAVADPALVNNLDLEVSVGGNTYRGNVFAAGVSTAGGIADTRNNVEQVLLPAGTAAGSPISVRVRATALNGDGVLGNADATDQHYALVVHNANAGSLPVISTAGASLATGSCTPNNGAIDPTEVVTVDFSLQNVGLANTTNLVATLQSGGGVGSPSAAQSYGSVVAGGAAVTRPFTFTASGSCGGTITATLALQDGPLNLGTVSFNFTLGAAANATLSFSNTVPIVIPGVGTANPYPSNISVSGMSGTVSEVVVTLNGFTHTFPDDVDVLLVGPGGQRVIIMSDVGGPGDVANVSLNLRDSAASAMPDAGPLVSGTFRPTNINAIGADTFNAPAPGAPYGTALSEFNGTNPNGIWSLYVLDDLSGDSGSFVSWSISVTAQVPVCATNCTATSDVSVTLSDSPDPVAPGAALTYVATLTNSGPASANGASISLPLPAPTIFVSAVASDGGTCSGGATVVCTWAGAVPASATRTATIVATVRSTASGTLNATVTAGATNDSNNSNNTASASTAVSRRRIVPPPGP